MTREEAIKIFNTVLLFGKCDCPKEEIEECLKMAIKALEQEPVIDKIRAEISTVYESLDGYDPDSLGHFLSEIDKILDKYKAEQEKV